MLILNAIVSHFQGNLTIKPVLLWILIGLLLVLPIIGSLCQARHNVIMTHAGVKLKNALILAIYRKATTVSLSSRRKFSTGQIVNLFSSDTAQIERLMTVIGMVIIAPIQIAVCLYLIYKQVGVAMFVGLGLMILFTPLSGAVFGTLGALRKKSSVITDSRVRLMNEILSGIRLVKYYGWEVPFLKKITDIRTDEIKNLRVQTWVLAIGFSLVLLALPVVQPILVFYTYIALGNRLDAATAFTTISLFGIIRFPFAFLPMSLASLAQSQVAAARILSFLVSNDLDEGSLGENKERLLCGIAAGEKSSAAAVPVEPDSAVRLTNVSCTWGSEPPVSSEESAGASAAGDDKAATAPATAIVIKDDAQESPADEKDIAAAGGGQEAYAVVPTDEQSRSLFNVSTLRNVSVDIKRGELVAVIGGVGSGKSSFLNCILGEMEITEGSMRAVGDIAYCDQRPWIMNATLKENVLFGLPYDEERFDNAIESCCLDEDINLLPGGVLTEIGERGINLSGGQKARVALARAVYRNADVYLLDDPLSAVDASVGQALFTRCISKALAGKTRVLVTHQVHLLTNVDRVIIFENGVVKATGTLSEIAAAAVDMSKYAPTQSAELGSNRKDDAADEEEEESRAASRVKEEREAEEGRKEAVRIRKDDTRGSTTIVEAEEKAEGSVPWSSYWYYIKSGGPLLFFGLIAGTSVARACDIVAMFWLARWNADASNSEDNGDGEMSTSRQMWYLRIYALIGMLGIAMIMVRSIVSGFHRLAASYVLHIEMLQSTLNAPISFFDVTPAGRILNRFSSDMSLVDTELPSTYIQLIACLINVLGGIAGIAVSTQGTFVAVMVPLVLMYYQWQFFFRKTSTELKRYTNISRSPIYSDFSAVLNGIVTIRAYRDVKRFVKDLERKLNVNTIPTILSALAFQWLSIRLDMNGALISFFVAALTAATSRQGFVPASYLALALSISFEMTAYLRQAVNMIAQTEAQMNSVERIRYYILNIPSEESSANEKLEYLQDRAASGDVEMAAVSMSLLNNPSSVNSSKAATAPDDWPREGAVAVSDLSMSYRKGPLILKGVSFDVKPRQKIGIVGRTGSG